MSLVERSALGALILNIDDTIEDAINILGPSSEPFEVESHRWIYEAIMHLYQTGAPVDLVSVYHTIEQMQRLQDCGGAHYIATLQDVVPTSHNFKYYASAVKSLHLKRNLLEGMNTAGQNLSQGRFDNEQTLQHLEGVIMQSLAHTSNNRIESLGDILPRVLADIQRSQEHQEKAGTPTGLKRIDAVAGGFRPETLNILAARPSVGKSALAVNFALTAAADCPVLFFSMEMGRASVVKRFVSVAASQSWATIERNQIMQSQSKRIHESFEALRQKKIYIMDNEKMDAFRLRANARRFAAAHFPKRVLIIIDYLQLCVRGNGGEQRRHEMIGDFTRECKMLSRELNCPFVLLSQLSREADSANNPFNCMHCLKDSGNIEEDADTVMIITKHCDEKSYKYAQSLGVEPSQLLNFGLVKNREGATCGELLRFDKATQQIECLDDWAGIPIQGYHPPQRENKPVERFDDIEDTYTEDEDGELI